MEQNAFLVFKGMQMNQSIKHTYLSSSSDAIMVSKNL